jgi:hypothetical protein
MSGACSPPLQVIRHLRLHLEATLASTPPTARANSVFDLFPLPPTGPTPSWKVVGGDGVTMRMPPENRDDTGLLLRLYDLMIIIEMDLLHGERRRWVLFWLHHVLG